MVDQDVRHSRVALAHDWLCGFRGGEAVLDRLARLLVPSWEAPDPLDPALRASCLFVLFDDARPVTPAIDALARETSFLNHAPRGLRRWLLPLYPAGVRDLGGALRRAHDRRAFDLVVSTSSSLVKGLRPPPGVTHVCYCHAPARYLWTQPGAYADPSPAGRARGAGLSLFGPTLRRWDRATSSNVSLFVANSTHTARAIRRAFDRDSIVVHPPVRTEFFTPGDTPRESFWLFVGALEPYKRADLAIEAARLAGRELVIAGEGTERSRLERLGGSGVRFMGRVSEAALLDLYRRADLLVFPQEEDFGIVAVEAQACGLRVLARRAGGALDSVVEGVTGAFFDEPTGEAIARAAERLPAGDPAACRTSALRFSEAAFDRAILSVLGKIRPGRSS